MLMDKPKNYKCHYRDTPDLNFDVVAMNEYDAQVQLKELAPDLSYQVQCELK